MCRLFRSQRLRKAADFERFRGGRVFAIRGGVFVLKVLRRGNAVGGKFGHLPRIGIITSKKIGNAVRRNRIKRVVREVFRLHRGLFCDDHDYLFIALRGICEMSASALRQMVLGLIGHHNRVD